MRGPAHASGEKMISLTYEVWPRSSLSILPDLRPCTRPIISKEPEATWSRSGGGCMVAGGWGAWRLRDTRGAWVACGERYAVSRDDCTHELSQAEAPQAESCPRRARDRPEVDLAVTCNGTS